jgi:RAB protein geranylgeranyltransferase component A
VEVVHLLQRPLLCAPVPIRYNGARIRYIRRSSHRNRPGPEYSSCVCRCLLKSAKTDTHRALAKSGKSVLHLDPNDYYGGQQASLTLDERQTWSQSHSKPLTSSPSQWSGYTYGNASSSKLDEPLEKNKRRYALSLFPAVLPSRGPLIQTLINSGVSKYVSFRILNSVSVWEGESIRRVPGSKEQVFKDKEISLMEKRRLMKFLMFTAGEFEDDPLLKGSSPWRIRLIG